MALPPITPYVVGLPYPLQEFIRQVRQALSGVAGIASISSSNISGVVDGSDAALGVIGEFRSANTPFGSAVALTNGVGSNAASFSLPAGDWEVYGLTQFIATGAATSQFAGAITLTSGTTTTNDAFLAPVISGSLAAGVQFQTPSKRINISATTTVYMSATALFSAGTVSAYGSIYARRMR